jgi:hypothetical protein
MNYAFLTGMPLSKEVIKEAFDELIQEKPELLKSIYEELYLEISQISERLDCVHTEQARDRARIVDIELLLDLDETLKNPDTEDDYFLYKKERLERLKEKSSIFQTSQPNQNQNVHDMLYEELKHVPSMRNKEILNFFGWDESYTIKATRLMRSMEKTYSDVVYETVPGSKRAKRIYIKI